MEEFKYQEHDYLSKQKDRLFFWLYTTYTYDDVDNTIVDVIQLCEKYNIPTGVVLYKIIEYLTKTKISRNDTTSLLTKHNIINNEHLPLVNKYLDEFNTIENNDNNNKKLSKGILNTIRGLSSIFNYQKESCHKGYPLPDKYLGRPRIDWRECYYHNCHQKFNTDLELIKHLESHNAYKYRFHQYHYDVVNGWRKLTPQKILKEKITWCPSYMCDKWEFTPEGLCDHFAQLGIEPFWQYGMEIKPDPNLESTNINIVYKTDNCVICLDNNPCILFLPCYHCNICENCFLQIDKCPYCRSKPEAKITI